ncbi:class I SAM-dependent methyltransferase [Isoptericola sp. NPDC057191]|uniref:class I SAM-dependent methyltransferase n=1 Tax=Isoptericola sp. NPDC057191 TaxID=3346041 RepID=UPI00362F4B1E
MPDAIFADPTLARLYDPLDPDRSDLDAYVALARQFGARRVLDVGCGTGTFAVLLAAQGFDVVGVDPAGASLDVARGKPGAERVRWLHGDATALPPLEVDLATMTANVAQVFRTDDDWAATLRGVRAALAPGGHLVFETRDPARRAWEGWTRERTFVRADVPGFGVVESWTEVTDVAGALVTFHDTTVLADGRVLHSDSTLRFRDHDELTTSLEDAGYVVEQVRDAPDRPGLEWVFVARAAERG